MALIAAAKRMAARLELLPIQQEFSGIGAVMVLGDHGLLTDILRRFPRTRLTVKTCLSRYGGTSRARNQTHFVIINQSGGV